MEHDSSNLTHRINIEEAASVQVGEKIYVSDHLWKSGSPVQTGVGPHMHHRTQIKQSQIKFHSGEKL